MPAPTIDPENVFDNLPAPLVLTLAAPAIAYAPIWLLSIVSIVISLVFMLVPLSICDLISPLISLYDADAPTEILLVFPDDAPPAMATSNPPVILSSCSPASVFNLMSLVSIPC